MPSERATLLLALVTKAQAAAAVMPELPVPGWTGRLRTMLDSFTEAMREQPEMVAFAVPTVRRVTLDRVEALANAVLEFVEAERKNNPR